MLKEIPDILSPDAVKLMMEMGHGDTLLIADGNYPATTNNPRVIRADGHKLTDLLDAVLKLFPLDRVVDAPVTLMSTGNNTKPPVWKQFEEIVERHEGGVQFGQLDRYPFYDAGAKAAGIIQSGDRALFGNIMLQKGAL
ncbi:RbsD/FucU family protein [Cutibacterium avidum]|uniref:Fucose isomerase n=1 Tax=Cutibacterium avidum TaxID=33010 RepID=A0A3E2DPU5_9ACTN|nr:RbsD/FucU domain-containing protein [Cutibacterium avidum]MDU7718505.1 RbsD/FucU domain-containing protein [Cutibacterium avidum]RFT46963.1 fucose isomerase [Cutibacterium avidum]TMT55903.1 fucose isomerase [Cutibacterium avidum]